jgi:phosphatidylglycerol:prolipoprotein diacylglycerol transferase
LRHELFRVFDIPFPAYFVLLLAGFAFATAIAVVHARRIGENPDIIVDLALAALLLGVIGGRIFHVLFDGFFMDYVHLCTDPSAVVWPYNQAECAVEEGVWNVAKRVCNPPEQDCWAWAKFWAGGLVYYGGFVFAAVGGILLLVRDRFPVWKACDLSAVGIALGLGFGRIGCLLAGCCFGRPYDGPLSLSFPPRSPASEAQFKLGQLPGKAAWSNPVIPTQPLEALYCFVVAAVCMLIVAPRKRYDGEVLMWFLGLYALGRFALEFLRADDRGSFIGLSTSQLISLGVAALAFAIHRMRMKTLPAVAEPQPAS